MIMLTLVAQNQKDITNSAEEMSPKGTLIISPKIPKLRSKYIDSRILRLRIHSIYFLLSFSKINWIRCLQVFDFRIIIQRSIKIFVIGLVNIKMKDLSMILNLWSISYRLHWNKLNIKSKCETSGTSAAQIIIQTRIISITKPLWPIKIMVFLFGFHRKDIKKKYDNSIIKMNH